MSGTEDDDEAGPSREELLALAPEIYLADGYLDAAGRPRRELRAGWASAAAAQLAARGVAVQELAFTYEALRSLLPQTAGPAATRAETALDDALAVTARLISQDNNEGLVVWLEDCVAAVRRDEDLEALMQHALAVLRLYSVTAAFGGDDETSPSPPSAAGSA